ncbi:MAG: hypothetical protein MHPSP_004454, partial [Paramarteilia canceri]
LRQGHEIIAINHFLVRYLSPSKIESMMSKKNTTKPEQKNKVTTCIIHACINVNRYVSRVKCSKTSSENPKNFARSFMILKGTLFGQNNIKQ